MQRFLAQLLIVLVTPRFAGRARCASIDHINHQLTRLKGQLDKVPAGTFLKVKRKHDGQVAGELVARSEDGFEIAAPEPINVTYAEVKSVSEEPTSYAQASPGNSQNPPKHHSHHVRNILIGVAAMCALAVVFAVAAK